MAALFGPSRGAPVAPAAASLLICGAAWLACSAAHGEAPAPRPPPAAVKVTTVKVEDRAMPQELILTGTLMANQQADVAANASGRVVKTFVERGAIVKQGAPLVQLDVEGPTLSEAEASANLEVAQAQRELATGQCSRNQDLYNKGAISKDEWERVSSQCKTTQGAAAAAQARAQLARKLLADATIRAPFSGMVGERFVSVGEYVQVSTRVASVVELKPLRLQITVPEADIGSITQGQQVSLDVQAYPKQAFHGTVAYIAPGVRAASRDLIVEAKVANLEGKLRPGMFATTHVHLGEVAVPVVPKDALRQQGGVSRCFVVVDGHLQERLVQVGAEANGLVAISDGLKAGEVVVDKLAAGVRDGVAVD